MTTLNITFPRSIGSTTRFVDASGKAVHLFMIDATLPLYNVVHGTLRFLASEEQVHAQVAALQATGAMPQPDWQWVLDAGFDGSVDGSHQKQWVMKPVAAA
ncbi:hypothetical protein [Paraburkholderia acidisoli]|uniref:Uncharacterized protein n=1 Tax=Paraburkholderia acidisoli TaxID=2571748 RepID=A0A7Z2GRH6_9BURK|nr:hypothetical protein [Paraburkholderia acidisoli]QGZ66628.1 hypothetical protein FAZ98_33275 [Paraburkholderia acidisoli]